MKKKSEEYVPCFSEMFEGDEDGKREVNRYTCTRCHRSVVSVVDGLCLECRNREYDAKTPASSMSKANEDLYNAWIKNKHEVVMKTFQIGFVLRRAIHRIGLSGLILIVGLFALFSAFLGRQRRKCCCR